MGVYYLNILLIKTKIKKMFKLILNIYVSILLFNNYQKTKAQIHLNRDNLNELCNCNSFVSRKIILSNKNISTIDTLTFNGLYSLQVLLLQSNQLTKIDEFTFKELSSLRYLYLSNNQSINDNY